MTKNNKTVVFAFIVIGLGAALVLQYRAMTKLRDENGMFHEQVQQLPGLAEENQRLSNLVAQARQNPPMSKEQFQELLRLRGEVGVLRKQKADGEKLVAENRQLRSAMRLAPSTAQSPSQDFLPKESWAFAGYASPEAALQSFVWGGSQGDVKTFLASLAPEERAGIENRWKGKSESEITRELLQNEDMTKVTALRIMNKQDVSDDEVVLTVYADGLGETNKFKMKRFGNEWKFAGDAKD